jgi:hypothetical protein
MKNWKLSNLKSDNTIIQLLEQYASSFNMTYSGNGLTAYVDYEISKDFS